MATIPVWYALQQQARSIPVLPSSPAPTLWFKADALALSDGASVSTWPDSSANGNTATRATGSATYHTGQINGQPAVTFSGSRFTFATPVAASSGHAVFAVFKRSDATTDGVFLGGDSTCFEYRSIASFLQCVVVGCFSLQGAGTASADTNWHQSNTVFRNRLDALGFLLNFRLDRAVDALTFATGFGNAVANMTCMGCGGSCDATLFFAGQIAELIFYNQALTPTQVTTIESYLHTKYGL